MYLQLFKSWPTELPVFSHIYNRQKCMQQLQLLPSFIQDCRNEQKIIFYTCVFKSHLSQENKTDQICQLWKTLTVYAPISISASHCVCACTHTHVCVYVCIYWYSALCKLFWQHCPLSVYRILYFTEMSVQGVDKRMINVHYYYYWSATFTHSRLLVYSHAPTMIPASKLRPLFADIFADVHNIKQLQLHLAGLDCLLNQHHFQNYIFLDAGAIAETTGDRPVLWSIVIVHFQGKLSHRFYRPFLPGRNIFVFLFWVL